MGRKKKVVSSPLNPNWKIFDQVKVNGRILTKNTEFSVKGERGRFRFLKYVVSDKYEWIDCIGGPKGYEKMRAFSPERVRRVHVKRTMRSRDHKSE